MKALHEKQIQSIIIEGGKIMLQQFIDVELWDEAIVIKNENLTLIHGTKAPILNKKPSNIEILRDNHIEFYKNPTN